MFKYKGKVRVKKHRHDEVMTFCCVHPTSPLWAIVVRSDGRLSEFLLKDLEESK